MSIHDTLFWFFSSAMLLSGLLVILNRNPVTSAMYLILLFVFMAGLFVLLEAFFIAAFQVLVYAGAVMVLFLFVIMLLDVKATSVRRFKIFAILGGFLVAGTLVWELSIVLSRPVSSLVTGNGELPAGLEGVMKPLFTHYLFPFELVAVLLLVAMIGVILLSRKELK